MTPSITEANAALRAAVEHRNEAQAAGLPHEEWYGHVAETLPERQVAADWLHDATRCTVTDDELQQQIHEHHLHRAGVTDDDIEAMSEEELDAAIERLSPKRTGSAPFLELLDELRALHLSKSQDYGSESDPLANIRQGAEFVGIEAWRGCMVRIADKVQRLRTYCQTGRLVHEGVRDTLLDLSAYSLLAIVLFDEGRDA